MFPLDAPPGPAPPPVVPQGDAAAAIREAETALARQNSVAAQVDLQVITAVLTAHSAHGEGSAALLALQREIESAVSTRTDLDTPAGAREFQRYLIDRLQQIRTVVEDTRIDDTSRAALAAALASLYATSATPGDPSTSAPPLPPPPPAAAPPPPPPVPGPEPGPPVDLGLDPGGVGVEGAMDPGPLIGDAPATVPTGMPASPPPAPPPSWGGGVSAPALPPIGGLPSAGLPSLGEPGLGELGLAPLGEPGLQDDPPAEEAPGDTAGDTAEDEPQADGPPDLTEVVADAVAGTPIAEAFARHGITVPTPGTPVDAPLGAAEVLRGDVGVFTDKHALALGNGKALVDNQIQPIDTVTGPGFLGWSHPTPAG